MAEEVFCRVNGGSFDPRSEFCGSRFRFMEAILYLTTSMFMGVPVKPNCCRS